VQKDVQRLRSFGGWCKIERPYLGLELLGEVEADLAVATTLVLQDERRVHVDGEGRRGTGCGTGLGSEWSADSVRVRGGWPLSKRKESPRASASGRMREGTEEGTKENRCCKNFVRRRMHAWLGDFGRGTHRGTRDEGIGGHECICRLCEATLPSSAKTLEGKGNKPSRNARCISKKGRASVTTRRSLQSGKRIGRTYGQTREELPPRRPQMSCKAWHLSAGEKGGSMSVISRGEDQDEEARIFRTAFASEKSISGPAACLHPSSKVPAIASFSLPILPHRDMPTG